MIISYNYHQDFIYGMSWSFYVSYYESNGTIMMYSLMIIHINDVNFWLVIIREFIIIDLNEKHH